ncbi:MAG: ABC transporter ATP-binding protein [Planctomycetota bacterium]|jgi:ABC-type lipoprotein export system ATPase subunit
MLELLDITKTYTSGAEETTVLADVNLTVEQGQTVSFVGPSGSGKTTLLNLIGGLDKPSAGKVMLNRTNLAALRPGELARLRNTDIGFIFQLHYLLPQCSVLENVLLPTLATRHSEIDRVAAQKRAVAILEKVGMEKYHNARPAQLSGGQRQRVAVARALINQPQILLADEPTGSLDAETAAQITSLLLKLNRTEKVTLIVATHSEKLAGKMHEIYRVDERKLTNLSWSRGRRNKDCGTGILFEKILDPDNQ